MPIALRSDQPVGDANDLTPAQVDGNWISLYGTPALLTIVGTALTVIGAGTYRVLPPSGNVGSVTAIAGAQRIGDEVSFLVNTAGHTITFVHGGNLHMTGVNFVMDTIYCLITFKCVLLSPMTWVEAGRYYNV